MRYVKIADGRVSLETGDRPVVPDGWARVRVLACGLCGTDLHLSRGMVLPKGVSYPVRPGHEVAGTVLDGGSRDDLHPGDRVVLHPIASCGECGPCLGGKDNLCARPRVLGLDAPGGMAEEVAWPADRVVLVRGLEPGAAALLPDAVATAYHALRLADLPTGGALCVLGAGGVGTQALQIAAALDPSVRMVAVVQSEGSRRRLEAMGAKAVVGLEGVSTKVRDLIGRPDTVLEFTGSGAGAACGVRMLSPGGSLVLGSIVDEPVDLGITTTGIATREIKVLGAYASTLADLLAVVSLAQDGRIDPSASVTHRFPLELVGDAFTALAERPDGFLRAVVEPD